MHLVVVRRSAGPSCICVITDTRTNQGA